MSDDLPESMQWIPEDHVIDWLTVEEFDDHIERMERGAKNPTYPVWKRPLRRYRLRLVDSDGRTRSERYGSALTRREAEKRAAEWNVRPLRPGYRLEVHRDDIS